MRTYFKPNKSKTGSLFSVSLTPESNGVFVNIVKQTGWDEAKNKGSFQGGSKVTIKFSELEVAGIKMALNTNGECKFFHTSGENKSQGSVKFFQITKEENGKPKTYTGFTFFVKKGTEEFKSNLASNEAADLSAFLAYAQEKFFDAAIENENTRRANYGKTLNASNKKVTVPEAQEDSSSENSDDIPF